MKVFSLVLVSVLTWSAPSNSPAQGIMDLHSDSMVSWEISGQPAEFEALWHTMDSMRFQHAGSLSCLYIGGSHVQAGWIGHGIRLRFEAAFPSSDRTRGWLLPYRMAQTDTPTHFRTETTGVWSGMRCTHSGHEAPFGSPGLRAHTDDANATWQHVSMRADSSLHEASSLEVWGDASGCIPTWLGHETLINREVLRNGSGWMFEFDTAVDTVHFGLESIGPGPLSFDLFATIQRFSSSDAPQFMLFEWGNNGAKIASAMRCEAWENEWPSLDLDLVFLGLGINDVHAAGHTWDALRFEVAYDSLVQRIQKAAPHAALVLLSNTDSMQKGKTMAVRSQQVHTVQQKVAKRWNCGIFDMGQAMGPPGCIRDWHELGLAQSDLIHFTPAGYDSLADLLFSSWIAAYESHRTSRSVPSSRER